MNLHGGDIQSLMSRMVHVKRKADAVAKKAAQPAVALTDDHSGDHAKLLAEYRKPITDEEAKSWANGADLDLISFQETLDAGNMVDTVCAAIRLARRFHWSVFGPVKLDIDPANWTPAAKQQFQYTGKPKA